MSYKTEQSRLSQITEATEKQIDRLSMTEILLILAGQPKHIRQEFEGYIQARDVDRIGQFILMQIYQHVQAKVIRGGMMLSTETQTQLNWLTRTELEALLIRHHYRVYDHQDDEEVRTLIRTCIDLGVIDEGELSQ